MSRSRFVKNYDIVLPWGELAYRYDFLFNTKKKEGWISPPASKSEIYQQKKTFSNISTKIPSEPSGNFAFCGALGKEVSRLIFLFNTKKKRNG